MKEIYPILCFINLQRNYIQQCLTIMYKYKYSYKYVLINNLIVLNNKLPKPKLFKCQKQLMA